MIEGCQQVMPSVVNPIHYMIGYNADLWDWSCKVKNHVIVTAGICKSLQVDTQSRNRFHNQTVISGKLIWQLKCIGKFVNIISIEAKLGVTFCICQLV